MLNPKTEERLSTMVSAFGGLVCREKKRIPGVVFAKALSSSDIPSRFQELPVPFLVYEQGAWFRFRFHLDVPSADKGRKRYLAIETGIYGGALTSRPQGLLLMDGASFAGVDIYHTEIALPDGGHDFELIYYTHEFFRPFELSFSVLEKDEEVEKAYFDFLVPLETVSILDKKNDDYLFCLPILEKAMDIVDLREPYSEAFYASLASARRYLEEHYYGKRTLPSKVEAFAQTHIDVAWLWDLDQTHEKARRSFSTVLSLMDQYPDYRFFSSTPVLYEFVREEDPDLFKRIRERIEEGRFEAEGSFWLECDCNLVDGESLIRQVLYGKRYFKKEFGVDCHILYEPDVFGYSASLPQIMKLSGIDTFVTAKIGLNDTNRMPYSSFLWKGIDGSEVFDHLLSTCHANPRKGIYDEDETTYVGDICSSDILGTYHRNQSKDFGPVSALAYGWGDGGGGPTRLMIEKALRYEKGVPGMPEFQRTTLEQSLSDIKNNFEKEAKELRRFPVWDGELYFEYHRGTYTSVPEIKKSNRDGESSLQRWEFLSSFASLLNGLPYPKEELESCWKVLLLNQFHDILPGSAIEKVYDDARKQFASFFQKGLEIEEEAVRSFFPSLPGGGLLVFNSNSFPVRAPLRREGKTFLSPEIPPMGYRLIERLGEKEIPSLEGNSLENRSLRVRFAANGAIVSVFDKQENREIVPQGQMLNVLVAYEDRPYQYDNWELAPYYAQKPYPVDHLLSQWEIHDGERVGFAFCYAYGNSKVRQEVTLLGDRKQIDFKTELEWNEPHQILKAHFPFDLRVSEAHYDIQYGSIARPTTQNDPWQSAKFEVCGQKWADMSEHSYGVALLNDGKYGYGAFGSEMSLTLVKGGSFPNPNASKSIPPFTYSLLPHSGGYQEGRVIEEAEILNRPLLLKEVPGEFSKEAQASLLTVLGAGVYCERIKRAEDRPCFILRFVEEHGDHAHCKIQWSLSPIRKAYIVDLMENRLREIPVSEHGIELNLKPFEICSVEVCL